MVSIATCCFTILAGAGFGQQVGQTLPKPLDAYPNQEAFGEVAGWHLKREYPGKSLKLLAIISWSARATKGWNGLDIDIQGNAQSFRMHLRGLKGGSITGVNRPKDVDIIQGFLDELDPSIAPPPLDEVLIVSFEHEKRWETRLYNRNHAPAELRKLYFYLARGSLAGEIREPWLLDSNTMSGRS